VDAPRSACFSASPARSMSACAARARPQTTARFTTLAISRDRLEVAVRGDREAGLDDVDAHLVEESATCSFSSSVIEAPGDCSPSRSVVSKMTTRSLQPVTDGGIGHSAAYDKGEAVEELIAHRQRPHPRRMAVDITISLAMAFGGLVVIVVGGRLLVDGAVALARSFDIAETVIGLTIVAIGTSMPELVTSMVAALRRHGDVALGNILGSNIYNSLGIGGVTGIIAPTAVPHEIATFDAPFMVGVSAVLLIMSYTDRGLSRVEGGILLAGYFGYLALIWP
jgi:Ca2+/Na+ antiporter